MDTTYPLANIYLYIYTICHKQSKDNIDKWKMQRQGTPGENSNYGLQQLQDIKNILQEYNTHINRDHYCTTQQNKQVDKFNTQHMEWHLMQTVL